MISVLLGLGAAAGFGSGDFVGGRASVSASTATVLVVSQACSVVGAFALAMIVPSHTIAGDVMLGVSAGIANVCGLGLLYHGLARFPASVIAPITAVVGALVPLTWGLARGERPSSVVLVGAACALIAGALLGREPGAASMRSFARGAPSAIAAGAALGTSLVLYSETSHASGQVPLLAARVAALVLAVLAILWVSRGRSVPFPRGTARTLAVGAGILDVTATALLVVATRRDLLSVIAPVVALAPGFTVALAWWVTRERVGSAQQFGLVLALVGLVLVAAG